MEKIKKELCLIVTMIFLCQNTAFCHPDINSTLRPPSQFNKPTEALIKTHGESQQDSERSDREIEQLLDKGYFGFDSVQIFKAVIKDNEILDIMEGMHSIIYRKFLGEKGAKFVELYFNKLRSLKNPTTEQIKQVFLELREVFKEKELVPQYYGEFREGEIEGTLDIVIDKYKGVVVDVGCGDNRLGERLLNKSGKVTKVIGTDIGEDFGVRAKNLEFVRQENPSKIPLLDNTADAVIIRYALHHMTEEEQIIILEEVKRIAKPGAKIIIYEDTYSLTLPSLAKALVYNGHDLHEKMKGLGSRARLRLLLSAIDIFSQGVKDKAQPFPFNFKPIEEWNGFFTKLNFKIDEVRYFGISVLHRAPLGVFILENQGDNFTSNQSIFSYPARSSRPFKGWNELLPAASQL